MDGQAIGSMAIGHAGLRALATEFGGPRPAAVRAAERRETAQEERTARASRP